MPGGKSGRRPWGIKKGVLAALEYREALSFLENLTKFGFNLGLGRIEELLRRLGNPHRELKVVHVGGTNGKGSTTAMLASVLAAAGYRAGAFTSPHLHSYTERYQINGRQISEGELGRLIGELRPYLEAMVAEGYEHPTEFEVCTAAAFLYFARRQVDFLVLEVGLGGIIDSTNVVERPLVTVITNVGMDHMDYLGRTIREIAAAKAGIVKPGVPLVTACRGEALEVVARACREKGAPLVLVRAAGEPPGEGLSGLPAALVTWEAEGAAPDLAGQHLTVCGRHGVYRRLFIPLLGRHQLENAAGAVAVLEILREQGYAVTEEALRRGLAATRWPARLEVLKGEPLVILDGAHNYDGARSLARALADHFPGRGVVLVIGMLGDKERGKVVAELAPLARAVVVTRPDSPRAANWRELADEARKHLQEVYEEEKVAGAVQRALSLARPGEAVVVTGSLYMVAEAREVLLAGT